MARLSSGAAQALVGRLCGRGAQFLTHLVLAKSLGPASFGLFSLGWSVLKLTSFIGAMGLQHGVIRFSARHVQTSAAARRVLRDSLQIALGFSLLLGTALFLSADWLAVSVFGKPALGPVLRIVMLALPAIALLRVAAASTRVTQRMKISVLTEDLGQPVSQLLLSILCLGLGLGLLPVVGALAVSFAIAGALAVTLALRIFSGKDDDFGALPASRSELTRFSVLAAVSGLVGNMNLWADRLFLGFFRPAADVGVYEGAAQVSMLFLVILSAFNAIFTPMIADLHHKGRVGELSQLYRVCTRWALYICAPGLAIMLVNPVLVMSVLFGGGYIAGSVPLLILTLGQLVRVATGAVGFLLIMTGNERVWMATSLAGLIVNAGLNVLLIPSLGGIGAACATSGSLAVLYGGGLFAVRQKLDLWPHDFSFLKGLVSLAAAAALMKFGQPMLESVDERIRLLVMALGGTVVFITTLVALGVDREDIETLKRATRRVGR